MVLGGNSCLPQGWPRKRVSTGGVCLSHPQVGDDQGTQHRDQHRDWWGQHSLEHSPALEIIWAEEENSAAPFIPFLSPLQHQATCLPCSRGAENIPGAGSVRVLKRFCSFTASQRAITFNTHPLSFSLAILLSVLHWLSFPSFLSFPLLFPWSRSGTPKD